MFWLKYIHPHQLIFHKRRSNHAQLALYSFRIWFFDTHFDIEHLTLKKLKDSNNKLSSMKTAYLKHGTNCNWLLSVWAYWINTIAEAIILFNGVLNLFWRYNIAIGVSSNLFSCRSMLTSRYKLQSSYKNPIYSFQLLYCRHEFSKIEYSKL